MEKSGELNVCDASVMCVIISLFLMEIEKCTINCLP